MEERSDGVLQIQNGNRKEGGRGEDLRWKSGSRRKFSKELQEREREKVGKESQNSNKMVLGEERKGIL